MIETPRWVGLDIGETSTSVCVLGSDEIPLSECAVASTATAIAEALSQFPLRDIAAVVMESGAEQGLARRLRNIGYPVHVVDAGKVHRFLSIRHNKTDQNDAFGLADVGRLGRIKRLSVHVRSADCQLLREQLVIRDHLVRQRTATKNALRSLMRSNGSMVKKITTGKELRSSVESELEFIAANVSQPASQQLQVMLDICENLAAHIASADAHIVQFAKSHPVTSRFLQIPGIGPICAVSFYTAIDDPHRFPRSPDVGAYLGMVPRLKQSGTSLRQSRITRAGNTMTRGHLYLSAGVLLSRAAGQCAIRDWGKALIERKGYRSARLAVARKLSVAMLSMWKRNADFQAYPLQLLRERRA